MGMQHKLKVIKDKGYYADTFGNIYSPNGEIFSRKHKTEHKFTVRVDGKRETISVHKFIGYLKFGDLIFEPNTVVIHLNGDVSDNRTENISYGTRSDAMMCIPEEKRIERANKAAAKQRKFTDSDIEKMFHYKNVNKYSYSKIAKLFNTSKGSISYIFNNSTSAKKVADALCFK